MTKQLPRHNLHLINDDNSKDGIDTRAINFCLNVNLFVKHERREEFIEIIQQNQRGARTEPLCRLYVWGASLDDPNVFFFHEEYAGMEGFLYHKTTDHFAAWERFAGSNPFSKPPEIFFFNEFK